ncbi:Pyruvate/2-oxoglutarate dehydrogenase complex, dihydrolipoamide dehydrogenase (E3) component [Granulicella rosea]|uniref:Pyruvate/2-oxoglutarate dehydrogenase complex, dihydrolipoamide dehydrogenase (E3) component n=1 Tax=Granulicella rosea TaxID=474952 RepID=A0A239DW46_9BACT|nr:FAD-containing oxidoreductase [Granulicella rosea]SNS36188.1 Pyruvate/2-oxoglutarate dehydrogenase complex, dihydrolipoamide dehydrogenase (E3) component [Granulicella rosea]
MNQHYDAIILGAGQAGPSLAGRLTAAGQTVAMVERHLFGGTCVNTGCIPTKTLVASAYAAQQARRGAEFGVVIGGEIRVDMKAVKARKERVLLKSRNGVEGWLRGMKGCTVFHEHARFVSPTEVRVGGDVISADRIFINVGGRASSPKLSGIDEVATLNNTSLLELDVLPEHLVVIGGSYIGLEFAQMYRRFGAQVTVVERGARLVAHEDEDISEAIKGILEAEGVRIRLHAECIALSKRGDAIAVQVDCKDEEPEIVGSHVLMAVGRRPNTDDLGLETAGVATDERGFIVVDDELRTNVPGIYALGDCNGRGAFTHTSYNDFEIVAENLLDGAARRVSDRIQCHALYIDPPLGQVGMTEAEVRGTGKKILVGTRPMTKVGRAVEKGESQGFMKVFVDAESELILGAAILGVGGDEAIHCILDTMYAKKPYTLLTHAVHIHPTVSELIPTMLEDLKPLV